MIRRQQTLDVDTDDRTFTELGGEEKLAVLVLRLLEAGVVPNQVRTIMERVIEIHQAVDAELSEDDEPAPAPPKRYGVLEVVK